MIRTNSFLAALVKSMPKVGIFETGTFRPSGLLLPGGGCGWWREDKETARSAGIRAKIALKMQIRETGKF